jgi:hypothetical protein
MIEKLLHIFPVGEILEVLEANEVQRPVTIRYVPGTGLRIRIRIQSGQWIRIQEGKNDPQKKKKFNSSSFEVLDGLF